MAKIKAMNYYSKGLGVTLPMEYISTKFDKFFYVKIPTAYDNLITKFVKEGKAHEGYLTRRGYSKYLKASTEKELDTIFENYFKEFFASSMQQEKVIVYQFHYQRGERNTDPDGIHARFVSPEDGDMNFKLEYLVLTKQKFGNIISYINKDGGREDIKIKASIGGNGDWIELPHTKEAEDFFKSIMSAFDTLADNFLKYLGTEKAVKKSIQSKTLLLK